MPGNGPDTLLGDDQRRCCPNCLAVPCSTTEGYDSLTGLLSHRAFLGALSRARGQCRRRNEPLIEEPPSPEEERHPARRWVVERTIAWLGKRRSIRTRWCKKPENWLALIMFACAHILFNQAFYG